MEYISDRKISDVEELRYLNESGWRNLTDEEKSKWFLASKGAINFADLNRIVSNLIEITIGIENFALTQIDGTETNPTPKQNWAMKDIPTKEQLRRITGYYNTVTAYTPFDYVDVDLFRFCTVDKLNNFENLIYETHLMIEEINTNGKYKHNLEWVKDDIVYRTEKKKMGLLTIQAKLPIGSKLTINKYYPSGTLYETITFETPSQTKTFDFEGSGYLYYEFINSRPGAEIYTLGKVGI